MAMSKLEWVLNGMNVFLSGELYNPTNRENHSWQCNAFTRGYNFVYNLYLEGHTNYENVRELFEVFTKEPLNQNVKKHCIAIQCTIQSKPGHEITVTLPVMTRTQFFCATVNKAVTDVNEVKRKLTEFIESEKFKIINSDIV